jgi:hypothetical protein
MLSCHTVFNGGKQTKAALSAASIVAVLAISACSGGGGGSGPPLLRSALIARGNPICAAAAQKIKAGTSIFPNTTTWGYEDPVLVKQYASTVVLPALQKEHDQLGAVRAVASDYGTLLGELQKAINKWGADKTLMASVNDTTFARFDALASDFGLTACSTTDRMVRQTTSGYPLSE